MSDRTPEQEMILNHVAAERDAQDRKWGEQNHGHGRWGHILGEEFGEVSKAVLEGDDNDVVTELTHVAAVAVAWCECICRKARKEADDG